jgi:hypothetical protein
MSDEIKVGNRVRGQMSGKEYKALGICGNWVWILAPGCTEPITVANCYLTLISPEPVTLRAKYKMGERVRSTLTNSVYRVAGIASIQYLTEEGYIIDEHNSEPVPAPCPTCKGSGKASE